MARGTPSPVEALPCGSESSNSTRSPMAARAVPRLMAVVVLPTPPFWLAMAMTREGLGSAGKRSADMGEPRDLEDAPRRVALAGQDLKRKSPGLARLRDLGFGAAPLQKEADR